SLGPIDLGALVIAPTHATAELRAGQKVLWLDPGMAFGTGHHESTRLALEELTRLEPGGRRVLDVGAGSGILAIAADLLGAVAAIGVDNDPATVPIARANARLNRSRAEFLEGTLAAAPGAGSFGLLLANLYAELHAQLAREYAQALTPDGVVIASGIMLDRAELARTALASAFAAVTERRTGEW